MNARPFSVDSMTVVSRWLLGGLFIFMGLSKALHPADFLKLTHQYDVVHTPWMLNLIGACLPWFETFCGLLLVAGIAVRGTALVLILMLAPMTGLVLQRALAIHNAQAIAFCAVKFDCGCGAGEVVICHKLVENALLIALAAWLLAGRGRAGSLRYALAP